MSHSNSTDEQGPTKEFITHPLKTSAGSLTLVWLCIAVVILVLALLMKVLHANRVINGGGAFPLVMLAVMALLGAGFCFILSRRARQEFGAMRRGQYLARWPFSESDGKLLGKDVSDDHTWRVKFLFWLPFVVIAGGGTVLSIIGAFAKSDPMVIVRIAPHALWIGALAGGCFAAPAHYLFGVGERIARELDPVAIFTRTGFYTPGRFIPVMDFAPGHRRVTVVANPEGQTSWLTFQLVQGMPGRPAVTHSVAFNLPVPAGRLEEARALGEHYQS